VGNNLEFGADLRRDGVLFRYGNITATDFPDARFDAVTCMSVVEHGVPLRPFLAESARILARVGYGAVHRLRPATTDTSGITMYGHQVQIFSPEQIRELVTTAADCGLALVGDLALSHAERPVHWKRTGLDYTFIRLTFRRAG
jgi:hypothetical protein